MGADMRGDIIRCCSSRFTEGSRWVAHETIELHDHGKRNDNGPLKALDQRRDHLQRGKKNVGVDDQNGVPWHDPEGTAYRLASLWAPRTTSWYGWRDASLSRRI